MADDEETCFKLWRVRKTVMAMCHDRGYLVAVSITCSLEKMSINESLYVLATWIRPISRRIQSRIRRSTKEMFYLQRSYILAISKWRFYNSWKWGTSIAERFNNIGCAFWRSNWSDVRLLSRRSESNYKNCKSLLPTNARGKHHSRHNHHSTDNDPIW